MLPSSNPHSHTQPLAVLLSRCSVAAQKILRKATNTGLDSRAIPYPVALAKNVNLCESRLDPIVALTIPILFRWPASGGHWMIKLTHAQMEEFSLLLVTTDMQENYANLQRFGVAYFADASQCEEAQLRMASVSRAG
jgi:hypothetical protein